MPYVPLKSQYLYYYFLMGETVLKALTPVFVWESVLQAQAVLHFLWKWRIRPPAGTLLVNVMFVGLASSRWDEAAPRWTSWRGLFFIYIPYWGLLVLAVNSPVDPPSRPATSLLAVKIKFISRHFWISFKMYIVILLFKCPLKMSFNFCCF